jgi:hypothetical protein
LKTSIGKLFTFVLALLFCHLNTSAKSSDTTYDIQSFEGKQEKLLIRDTYSETIIVIHKSDTLTFYGNKHGVRDVKLLNPYFLQITYAMRGGSEVKRRAIVVVCIYNNKLHIPLPVFTTSESFVHGMLFDFSRVSLKIEPDLKNKFEMTVTEHVFVRDLDNSSKILWR